MEAASSLTLLMVIILVAGITAQVLANLIAIPSIVFLLLFGVLLGPDGLGVVRPQLLGIGTEVIVALSVALILFEGGLNLDLQILRKVSGSLRNLVTLGPAITLVLGAAAAHWLSEFPWPIAFIYASLVVVTGPTVVTPILKRVQVSEAVATLLEGEGVIIDPIGALLAVVVLNLVLAGDFSQPELGQAALGLLGALSELAIALGLGAGIGALGGWLVGQFLRQNRQSLSEELVNSVVLAAALGIYVAAQTLVDESGLAAAVTAGIVVRQVAQFQERQVRRFQGQLVLLAISVLFILLTANLSLPSVLALGWGAVGTVAFLMLGVRPLTVWLCTLGSPLSWRDKLFAAWLAPRGIVAASVSSLFAIVLAERNINGGEAIKALVFLTIAMTVILQGLTAGLVAQWLKLESERVTVIVGNNAVGRNLARILYNQGLSVSLVAHLATATPTVEHLAIQGASETQAIDVLVGNALDESLLVRAHLDRAERLVVVTMNSEVNRAIAELAIKAYKPPRVQAVINRDLPISESVIRSVVSPSDLTRWERYIKTETTRPLSLKLPQRSSATQIANCQARLESSEAEAVPVDITGPAVAPDTFVNLLSAFAEQIQAEAILPMVIKRQQRFFVFAIVDEWQGGDEVFFLARPGVDLHIRYQPLLSTAEMTENASDTVARSEVVEASDPIGNTVPELSPEEAES